MAGAVRVTALLVARVRVKVPVFRPEVFLAQSVRVPHSLSARRDAQRLTPGAPEAAAQGLAEPCWELI